MLETLNPDTMIITGQLSREKNYWMEKLSGELIKGSFPADFPETDNIEKITGTGEILISDEVSRKLLKLTNGSDARLHMILSTALILLINKYTGNSDIIIGMPIYRQISYDDFINTVLIIRNRINRENTFKTLLLAFRNTLNEAIEHQNYSLTKLLYDLGIGYTGNSFPLFDVAIMLENIHERDYLKDIDINMLFSFKREGECVRGIIEYNEKLYRKETADNICFHFLNLLTAVLDNIDILPENIDILSEKERRELLYDGNNTSAVYPREKTICDLFEAQVKATPDNTAVTFSDRKMTYRELNEKAGRLASCLTKMGIGPGSITGIMAERSFEMITGILGILKAGGAYLPLDVDYPEDRIQYILQDSGTEILLTQQHLSDQIPFKGRILNLDNEEIYATDFGEPERKSTADDPAYIIYTSGSTGNPKGVIATNRGLVNYIWWAKKVYLKGEALDFPLYSSISFDLTITSLFTPLISGSRIIIYDDKDRTSLIKKIIEDNKAEIIKLTPTHLSLIKDMNLGRTGIKRLIVGGEDLKTNLAGAIHQAADGQIEIYNEYGPTETVVGCMIYKFDYEKDVFNSVPIGKPADNVKIYLLDSCLNPVARGAVGEIYISGDGVAAGYIKKPELTADRFLDNPFVPGAKLYKSGDLARRLSDGNIEFMGRADDQIKLHGYRIEPGEIENRLLGYGPVKETAVIARENEKEGKYLCAYLVADSEITVKEIREYLSINLPHYMIPAYFIQLEKIPVTVNGKADRKALMELDENIMAATEYEAPRNEIEEKLIKIWHEELLVKRIGISDNFFALGGNSIKAMLVVENISEALHIELQVMDLFNKPTIKELADSILNIDSGEYRHIMRLNAKTDQCAFVFPPMAGLGIAYKPMADYVKSHTLYAFDFIEKEDRLEQYLNMIAGVQEEGPYILMAFSSGGMLLYDVAREMEKQGMAVSDIILIDCIAEKKIFSDEELEQLLHQEISALTEVMLLNYPARWKYIEKSIERRIRQYLHYISRFNNNARINADIHQILCSDKNIDPEILHNKKKWSELTAGSFLLYEGSGKHTEMLVKYRAENMEIITRILSEISLKNNNDN